MTPEDERAYEDDVLTGSFMDVRRVSWRNADYLNTSAKVQRLREIVEDASEDSRKVLVFSFFLDTLEKVRTVFGTQCVGVINGAVPVEERQNIVDAFEAAPAGSVLAAQIQSGGTGLNIQSASVVVLCEPQYKPSTENQAIGRAHRMGQTRDVLVYRLLCPNTVDERMIELIESKQAEFDTYADESAAAARDAASEQNGVDVNEGVVVEKQEVEKQELDNASINRIFESEKARILEKRQREGEPAPLIREPEQAAPQVAESVQEALQEEIQTAPSAPVSAPVPAPSEPVSEPEAQNAPSMIFCRFCGKKIPQDSVFCSYCGKDVR